MRAIVTVIGEDQIGIIAKVSAILYDRQVNILDISQTVMQGYFTMIMLVDVSAMMTPFAELANQLKALGESIGLVIQIQREDIFHAMHRP